MHDLKTLSNLGALQISRQPLQGHSPVLLASGAMIGCRSAVLKYEPSSICEVLGYALARACGVRVPRTQGIWTTSHAALAANEHNVPYRIGVLVEWLGNVQNISGGAAVRCDRSLAVSALAFDVFVRDELGEFVLAADGSVYVVDLEFSLGIFVPERLMATDEDSRLREIAEYRDEYMADNANAVRRILNIAAGFDIREEVETRLRDICELPISALVECVSVTGHPLAGEISAFAGDMVKGRVSAVASILGIPKNG